MFGERDNRFFALFEAIAANVAEAAKILERLTADPRQKEELTQKLEELEHRGDEQTHDIIAELNKAFITPIDREDIFLMAKELDNVLDAIEATAHRFLMFEIVESTEPARALAAMIVESADELGAVMSDLRRLKRIVADNKSVVAINRIEDDADKIYRRTVRELYAGTANTIEIVKWREIYDHLENTLDALEDVANIVEGIAMKHT